MNNNFYQILKLELKGAFKNEEIDRLITLYESVVSLGTPVEQGVASEWLANIEKFYTSYDSRVSSHNSITNIESFMKKLLYLVNESVYSKLVSQKKGLFPVLENLGVFDFLPKEKGTVVFVLDGVTSPLQRAVITAYNLRNLHSHTSSEWSMTEMNTNVNAVILATFYAVWLHREVLESAARRAVNRRVYEIDASLKNVLDLYSKKLNDGFKYMPLVWTTENSEETSIQLATLREEKHIMLVGEAGCGKSTSVDLLEYQDAWNYCSSVSKVIPVKIELIKADCTLNIKEIICRKLNIPMDYCEKLIRERSIHLYIDGMNEISASEEARKSFVISLQEFLNENPDLFVVITDRKYSAFKLSVDKRFFLKPMGKDEILRYAYSRTNCTEKERDLIAQLLDRGEFKGLEFTPFLINQLVDIFAAGGGIPESAAAITGMYLTALLEREHAEKNEPAAAPGRLELLLMRLSQEEIGDGGISRFKALKIFAATKAEYDINVNAEHCLALAIQLGILKQSGDKVDFASEEYRSYYLIRATELEI